MSFAAPSWLLLFVPWGALLVYLLMGRRPRTDVPFLQLWQGPIQAPRVRRSVRPMPLWIALWLLAVAVAIAAAGGPQVRDRHAEPDRPLSNVGISAVAVQRTQVMVRVLNQSLLKRATLQLTADTGSTTVAVDLPPAGEWRNYFIDLPRPFGSVSVSINERDDVPADNSVQLTRRQSWPVVEVRSTLPEEARRMIDVYTTHRLPSDNSPRIAVTSGDPSSLGDESGIVLAHNSSPVQSAAGADAQVQAHPVTENVSWSALGSVSVASIPAGWSPLVTVGGTPIVALRETAMHSATVRQVWIGFTSPDFTRTPSFVIFWTSLLDWVGQAGETFDPVQGTVFAQLTPSESIALPKQTPLAPWLVCTGVALSVLALIAAHKGSA